MSHEMDSNIPVIVVIEDNSLNLKLVAALLTKGGYRYYAAKNAERGIELIKEHLPDLVLMDIQLPGMDGLSATRKIKADPDIRHIPVVAISAHAMRSDLSQAESTGVVGYITKPFSTRTFLNDIAHYLPGDNVPVKPPVTLNKKRVLVVDDEPLNLKLVKATLRPEGYDIKCLTSGKQILEVISEFLPDIILLDVIMPERNGFAVLKEIKSNPDTMDIPVILITQLDGTEDKARGLRAGADDFLNKPLNGEELKIRVRSLLRMKRYKEQLDGRAASARRLHTMACGLNLPEGHHLPCILIAEDDAYDAKLLNQQLHALGCRVVHAQTGEAALSKVQAERPDVVLLDLVLPDIDGWRVCQKIKGDESTRNTQVVIVTSLKDLDSRIRGIEAGADDYLIKPIQSQELCARLAALIKKKTYLDNLVDQMSIAVRSSITDSLTGLYTHGYMKHFIDMEIQRAQRYNHSVALIMVDVDNFKRFNDAYGHLAGDAALLDLASVFKDTIRATDLPARYGGEEFAIVLPYTDYAGGLDVADRIQGAIAMQNRARDEQAPALPTVSMGISCFPSVGIDSTESLIEQADKALYHAKDSGKNCYRIADLDNVSQLSAARK